MQAFMGSVMESNMGPVMGSDMGSVMGSVIGLVMGIVRRSQCQKSLFVAPLLTYHKGKVQSCQGSFRYKCILIKSKASNINQRD